MDTPRWSDWRRGFDQACTGLDCRECGARVGMRPELTQRHRRWHQEMTDLLTQTTTEVRNAEDA